MAELNLPMQMSLQTLRRAGIFVPGFLPVIRDLWPGVGQRRVVVLTEVEGHGLGEDRGPIACDDLGVRWLEGKT